MNRDKAFKLLLKYIAKENMISHSLASEAVMYDLAIKLNEDPEKWALAGLLHDIDVEITNADAYTHGQKAIEILKEEGIEDDIINAIAMHNEISSGKNRSFKFEHALAAGETITGLITATTLVYPDKKIAAVKPKSIVKRMKEKAFAASVNRENIMECEKLGLSIDEFAELALNAMKKIDYKIGL